MLELAELVGTRRITRARPSATPGEAANPVSTPSPAPFADESHSWTRSVVIPKSMIVCGSVIASGTWPRAGGGAHSRIAS